MKTFDEIQNNLVVGNLWDLEVHIREASDVITQGFIFSVLYPLEIVLVSRLLTCGDEIVDERLPQFLP